MTRRNRILSRLIDFVSVCLFAAAVFWVADSRFLPAALFFLAAAAVRAAGRAFRNRNGESDESGSGKEYAAEVRSPAEGETEDGPGETTWKPNG